jgi:hypothetical protein
MLKQKMKINAAQPSDVQDKQLSADLFTNEQTLKDPLYQLFRFYHPSHLYKW